MEAYRLRAAGRQRDGKISGLDFNARARQTAACPHGTEKDRIEHRIPLGVRHEDMTGGRAMQEPGYEPVEEG